MLFDFELVGLTPFLGHADDVEAADDLEAWRKDPGNKSLSKAGDDRSPAWTWLTYAYHDGEYLAMPQENIMASIMKAAANFTMKGQKSFKAESMASIVIPAEYCRLIGPKGQVSVEKLQAIAQRPKFKEHADAVQDFGFKLFVKRAKVGQSKHVRVRPRFDDWRVEGQIDVDTNEIPEDTFRLIFEYAGNKCGLGDWRPSAPKSPGPYGRFTVKLKAVG